MAKETKKNVDYKEVEKFNLLAHKWWDKTSEFQPLHEINPLRMNFITDNVRLSGARVLDVGCGHGFFLYAAKQKGFDVHGIDIDEDAMRYGKEIMGLDIKRNPVDSFDNLPSNHYDIVTFWQVLEHLPNPGTCIREVMDLLKVGGIVAGSVPNIGGIG